MMSKGEPTRESSIRLQKLAAFHRFSLFGVAAVIASLAIGATVSRAATEPVEPEGAFVLGLPEQAGPLQVQARFDLYDINEVDDERETFEFTGVLTLEWRDPRQGFDPALAGTNEKIFQGNFQFNEISPGWYPQVILVNEAGLFQMSGVLLRVQPDGTSKLIQTINANAEVDFDMRRFPFDRQRLEAIFTILGFDRDEVSFEAKTTEAVAVVDEIRVPQWTVTAATVSTRDFAAPYAGSSGLTSALIMTVDVERMSWYARRLVVLPLMVIVMLSFSVFWMDRSSLADRLSVSFIGILTGVAYQMVVSDQLPRISYFTLIHTFLGVSFLTMCATVLVNLAVAIADRKGKSQLGLRIDRVSRWAFPLAYFGVIWLTLAVEFLLR